MTIRTPRSLDAQEIASLVKSSFNPELHPYLIQTQVGIVEYLTVMLGRLNASPPATKLVSVGADDHLNAYADFRTQPDGGCFLSYICVLPEAQGHGLASSMIRKFLSDARPRTLRLDVFDGNTAAIELYKKLGFVQQHAVEWSGRSLARTHDGEELGVVQINDGHAAYAHHKVYGFCEFDADWQGKPLRFGRIGLTKLRMFDPASLQDSRLIAALSRQFPEADEAFTIRTTSPDAPPHPSERTILTARRMLLNVKSNRSVLIGKKT